MQFELKEYHRNISDNELILDLQNVVKENNVEILTIEQYEKLGKYSKDTITRRFGSWSLALQKANIKTIQVNDFINKVKNEIDSKLIG